MSDGESDVGCLSWMWTKDPARDRDKENSKMLRKWHREEQKVVKLLLLGTGESGKSTVSKQMKIIHVESGYTDEEKRATIPYIRKNISDAILTIVGAMYNLNIELEHPENKDSMEYIMNEVNPEDFQYPQVFYDHVARLWADGGVQTSYSRAHEYQLIDSSKYFLDKVEEVRQESYMPSIQDILRNRVMTNTIQRMDFTVNDRGQRVNFSVFDVGGQRGERRKWIQVFESITAILFVLDCSCFDLTLREDRTRNRLIEAIATLEQTWNTKFLRRVSIIVFFNKIDLLEEKIRHGKTLRMLIERDEDHPYNQQFEGYYSWPGPTEREVEEFAQAFPAPAGSPSHGGKDKKQKKPDLETLLRQKQISEETVRTAVFIKQLVMKLLKPRPYDHIEDYCERFKQESTRKWYYTCAVDTSTLRAALEDFLVQAARRYSFLNEPINTMFAMRKSIQMEPDQQAFRELQGEAELDVA